ncbi:MAG: response regulator [Paracoccaceae bacterium]
MNSSDPKTPAAAAPASDAGRVTLLGHDLRAAVSDIIGGLRLIEHDGLDAPARLQLERVRAASETLARLLEEGLALMLGEDDFISSHPASVQMARLLYDVEMRWSGRASEKGLGFRVTKSADVPEALTLDRIALERVLSNILSNALKYTDAGEVHLDVAMTGDGSLQISCCDQGPGFSDDALTRLFEYRGRPAGNGKPGQGLGMHIARAMIGRLGGTVSVENLAGGGACVTLELPPETWSIAAPDSTQPLPDLTGTRVLVAEDSPTNQMIIGQMLTKLGAHPEIAEDGVEALNWLERETFDLALVDIEMPRLGGIEVIRKLRADGGQHANLPVVAITAYVLRANRDAIYAAGANSILAKPLAGIEHFGLAIGEVLNRARKAPRDRTAAAGELAEFDRATFDRLIEIAGPSASRELLDRLCVDLRKCERNLIAALAESNVVAVRSETHVLIALAGAVGAARLQALVQALNTAAHRRDTASLSDLAHGVLAQLDRLIHFVTQEQSRRGEAA